jgi:DNA primase catalytic subunit
MKKKSWLDYLFYDVGNQQYDFFVSGLRKVGDKIIPTKWKHYSEVIFPVDFYQDYKIEWINQRQILPNEVVLDLEEKEMLSSILRTLENLGLVFYAFDTGSRGYHIHIFFKRELSEKEKSDIIKYFGADIQKASSKTMIALEFENHWKSGKIKELVKNGN